MTTGIRVYSHGRKEMKEILNSSNIAFTKKDKETSTEFYPKTTEENMIRLRKIAEDLNSGIISVHFPRNPDKIDKAFKIAKEFGLSVTTRKTMFGNVRATVEGDIAAVFAYGEIIKKHL